MSETSVGMRRKGRSPAYPGINLETAVQRVRQLYERERQHSTPVGTIAEHWGYKSLNGPGSISLSALKKFGLADDEGSGVDRRARLTDLAVDLIENPSADARREAAREAALNPGIHRELWDKYGLALPSDPNLRWELTRERGFTVTGAEEFIREYRETIAFAQLSETESSVPPTPKPEVGDGTLNDTIENRQNPGDSSVPPVTEIDRDASTSAKQISTYSIPLPRHAGSVQLSAKFPLSESEWEYLMGLLQAMKAGLVDDNAAE